MEDAAEALKLAFSVFVFVIALGLAFTTFNQSKQVSDIVIAKNDRTYLEAYVVASDEEDNGRIVGVENLIPTLYRYYKENFSVDITNNAKKVSEVFDLETERKYYYKSEGFKENDYYRGSIKYKDLFPSGIHWIGSKTNTDAKLRVDAYVTGEEKKINDVKIRYSKALDFNQNYYQTFEETYTGIKQTIIDPTSEEYDGTFFTVESGGTKVHLIYRKMS